MAWGGATTAEAQARETLGVGRLFTNDRIGDGSDRWRTGSYGFSVLRGPEWQGRLPSRPGDVVEYRFRGEIAAPNNLNRPNPASRLYAGVLSAGAHMHFDWQGFDIAAGVDLMLAGDQTGLASLQGSIHDALSLPQVNVDGAQIDNGVYLHGTIEVARDLRFSGGAIRPFIELQGGFETLARAGVDVTIGNLGDGGLMLRDPVTGQRFTGINSEDDQGFSFILGGDVAYVDQSEFFPEGRGPLLEEDRYRLRAGVNYAIGTSNIFYGLTYLSEEYVGQGEGQVVGSVTLGWVF